MSNSQERVSKAQAAVDEAGSRVGKDHIEVSYKLDELALALKDNGQLLEAANASAKARAIRTASFARDADEQAQKYGESTAANQGLTAVGWLKKLRQIGLIGSAVVFVIFALLRTADPTMQTVKELVGSSAAATFLQLLLFPIKALPRIMKFAIVGIGTAVIWKLIGG